MMRLILSLMQNNISGLKITIRKENKGSTRRNIATLKSDSFYIML